MLLVSGATKTMRPLIEKRPDVYGALAVPRDGNRLPETGRWAADNGAFSGFEQIPFLAMLGRLREHRDRCLFVAAPDVVGDAVRTSALFREWQPIIARLGFPVALVAQDGHEPKLIPWTRVDAVFIGGTDDFKMGVDAAMIVTAAGARGKWTHMGRVNTGTRIRYAMSIGCDSVDGSGFSRFPNEMLRPPPQAVRGAGVVSKPTAQKPGILVSFVYLDQFLKHRAAYDVGDWMLDSGAFTAFFGGKTIDLQAYTETAKRLRAEDKTLVEVVSLDVINDWRAGLKNVEAMWKAGVEAIPTYHLGEPWDVLVGYARDYPKIAVGGMAQLRGHAKLRFAEQCVSRVWPKRVHGFGVAKEDIVLGVPFHSTDASSWELRPMKFGSWKTIRGRVKIEGGRANMRAEVDWYLSLERRARRRWAREMKELKAGPEAPRVRLAIVGRPQGMSAEKA